MNLECFAILIIIGLLSLDFIRRGRKEYALCSAPLLISPLVHLLTNFTSHYFTGASEATIETTLVIADSLAFIVTVVLLILCSRILKSKKSKIYYIVCCSLYSALLTVILVMYTLSR